MAAEHPYAGRRAALATMHGKERAVAPAMAEALGLVVEPTAGLDTDRLGTFSGEVPRPGTMLETALAKARLGLAASGLDLALASEGSFGPHPVVPFLAGGIELLLFHDAGRGLTVHETLVADATNFAHLAVAPGEPLDPFLAKAGFPAHALIVRPNRGERTLFLAKGLADRAALDRAVAAAAAASADGRALVETDMRAHLNPTRMGTIAELARRLAARLACLCPACAAPGWGRTDVARGLPCGLCGSPTEHVLTEIFGCAACPHREERPRRDDLREADPMHCPVCNP